MTNNLDIQYQSLLSEILSKGSDKDDRTGTGTLSVFGRLIRHKMSDGFPLLTTKKMAVKTMVTELKWFLKGDTNIKYLVDSGCNIWNGDAYKAFKKSFSSMPGIQSSLPDQTEFINKIKTNDKFADTWGELGPIYGKQWRGWEGTRANEEFDQINSSLNLLKTNPDSRRNVVNAWNVGELDQMVLPPCHNFFQLYTRKSTREEKITNPGKYRAISLMWNQRSVDTFLGLPFNIASYGMLLEMIAKEVNMIPDELIGTLGDVHLYKNHIEQAKEQISRNPFELPQLKINSCSLLDGEIDYEVLKYKCHPSIKAPLSN